MRCNIVFCFAFKSTQSCASSVFFHSLFLQLWWPIEPNHSQICWATQMRAWSFIITKRVQCLKKKNNNNPFQCSTNIPRSHIVSFGSFDTLRVIHLRREIVGYINNGVTSRTVTAGWYALDGFNNLVGRCKTKIKKWGIGPTDDDDITKCSSPPVYATPSTILSPWGAVLPWRLESSKREGFEMHTILAKDYSRWWTQRRKGLNIKYKNNFILFC